MKKILLIIFIVLAGTTVKLFVSFSMTGRDITASEIFESLFFAGVFSVIIAFVFYRKELKETFFCDKGTK